MRKAHQSLLFRRREKFNAFKTSECVDNGSPDVSRVKTIALKGTRPKTTLPFLQPKITVNRLLTIQVDIHTINKL